jgi:hypothetical protein
MAIPLLRLLVETIGLAQDEIIPGVAAGSAMPGVNAAAGFTMPGATFTKMEGE